MNTPEIEPTQHDVEAVLRQFSPDEDLPVVEIPVAELILSESPRSQGICASHVHTLTETDAALPPILVHHDSMKVIDGLHRVQAAILKGERKIRARFFRGSDDQAYLLAVKLNTTHGLPLQLADRRDAALRILGIHPELSNRAISEITRLSDKTVAKLRVQKSGGSEKQRRRVGKDGRSHPLDVNHGRLRASQVIADRPDASLREIARAAGVSPNTARRVRNSLREGQTPLLKPAAENAGSLMEADFGKRSSLRSLATAVSSIPLDARGPSWLKLKRDPSLRSTETGRFLLRSLSLHALTSDTWERVIETIPPHAASAVADVARRCAAAWQELADRLEKSGN
ncbi:ParB N-terminal domain-containing protein [Streptomyces sp. NPDC090054]|uniref:ParB/RepB/Spo0J family partition protein n=1 Tax=Streptomyces sp. NPDC090054 TaxID=3365933 RepID=UPI003825C77D